MIVTCFSVVIKKMNTYHLLYGKGVKKGIISNAIFEKSIVFCLKKNGSVCNNFEKKKLHQKKKKKKTQKKEEKTTQKIKTSKEQQGFGQHTISRKDRTTKTIIELNVVIFCVYNLPISLGGGGGGGGVIFR